VVVHETPADLAALQDLLDRSYAAAGRHLLSIITPERRLDAEQVADRLTGMSLLALATVTADGRPIIGPVDGIFFRGAFHFGSSPDSIRFRHIRNRPHVSATHTPREEFAVTVHGRAIPLDIDSDAAAEFRQTLLEIYLPRYGPQWEEFLESGPLYARIDADRMFTFCMAPAATEPLRPARSSLALSTPDSDHLAGDGQSGRNSCFPRKLTQRSGC
jgi:nitroimidazol reductase NimA-like FMN-containing flavoprotein (pyridoxamine 5'-phosphate oxidase superfamily)